MSIQTWILPQAPDLSTIDTFVLNTGATLTLSAAQFDAVTISDSDDYVLQDGATALLSLGNADLLGAAQVVVTGEPTIAQLKALTDAGAALIYDTVYDTADALEDEVTNGSLITPTTNVVVTDPIAVADLGHLESAVSAGGTVFAKNLQDDIDNLIPGGNVHTYVIQGTNITVGDNATVEQIQALDAKNGEGKLTYSLQDTLANLRKADVALLSGAGTIVLSSLTLGEVKVADVQWLRDLLLDPLDSAYPLDPLNPPVIEGPSGNPITLADLIFTLKDT